MQMNIISNFVTFCCCAAEKKTFSVGYFGAKNDYEPRQTVYIYIQCGTHDHMNVGKRIVSWLASLHALTAEGREQKC